ncbi:MAG: helix-turn-helix domain-containing protein, partial [Chloroflexaceae bacterium]|nr:helix-turn-helix domain-containing protein [Chloroflexaceae bacterium]
MCPKVHAMNTIQRAHKIRLNPTPEQEQYFRQAAG